RGGFGFNKGRSNHLSGQGSFRPGVGSIPRPCGGVWRSAPHAGLRTTYPPSQPLIYQDPPPSSLQQVFLRPSLLESQALVSQQTFSRQPVQFMQQSTSFAPWNIASIPYAYCGPQMPRWQFMNSNYSSQQTMVPQGIPLSRPRQQVVQELHSANYEGNLDGVVEPTPLPAFTTGTPPRQEDPPAL
ncbi:unnamed protein product, partial [Taenia asiatica]|uniref:Aryl hydrocarbon receptor nuclear translocator n=1 Tax=Taenia asiatica TaxID=60517 RepID=A0A0R3VY48_TAEAS